MSVSTQRRAVIAALVLLVLAGSALRLFRLNAVAIRGDEVFTIRYWMQQPLAVTMANNATADPQPPLAFAVYRGWALVVGDDLATARMLPALLNVVGIAAIYALGKRLGGWHMGLVAAALWTVHPFQIWHAQDARNYAIWSTVSLLALWLGLRAVQKRRLVDWALYVVAGAAAAYLYYLELFVLLALNLYVLALYWHDRRLLGQWFASQVAIGLILAPWYLQERLLSGGGYGGTTGGLQLERLWSEFLPVLNFGTTLSRDVMAWLWLPLLLGLLVAAILVWRGRWRLALLPTLLGVIPPLLLALVSLRLNVFTPRYVLGAAPAYVLFVAALFSPGVTRVTNATRALGAVLAGAWLVVAAYSLSNYYFVSDYAKSPEFPALVSYLAEHVTEDDIIVQAAADEALNFTYEEFSIPFDRKQLPANPGQSVEEITSLLEADRATHRSLWRVAQTFPDWQNFGVVEHWLSDNMQQVRSVTVSGLRAEQWMPWDVADDELADVPLVTFDGVAELANAHVVDGGEATNTFVVWLYWQPIARTDTPLKVFVQLLGDANPATNSPVWSQDDQFPQDGRIATDTWTIGEVYRDVYALPLADMPPGEYRLVVGFYDPNTGERILTSDGQDSVFIATIRRATSPR